MPTCALCGGRDEFAVGICAGCAANGRDQQILLVRPALDRGARQALRHALREWPGTNGGAHAIEQTTRGAQSLAIVPSAIAAAAIRTFDAAGITTRAVPLRQWPRALPASFTTMIAAVVMAGALAGWKAGSLLLWTTPLLVTLLMTAAWLQLRKPLIRVARSEPALPAPARNRFAAALAQLPAGRTRGILLDLAGVGEQTYASLSSGFRRAPLGVAVVELVSEAAALGLEIMRLENVDAALEVSPDTGQPTARAELRAGIDARIKLLADARNLLAGIAGQQAELDDGGVGEVNRLLEQVRSEQHWRRAGEAAVNAISE